MTRLQGGPSVVQFPAGAINCSVRCVEGTFAQGESGRSVKLTTHLHMVQKLRMNGNILLLTLSFPGVGRDTVGFTAITSQIPN